MMIDASMAVEEIITGVPWLMRGGVLHGTVG